jgi:ABC-type Fe3+/spermidine/putrescine transport system ATPase subunit
MSDLRLQALTKRFDDVVAVNGLDLAVAAGELVGFLGPSGCGKTTTLRLIAGFETPTAGRVVLGEKDITALPPERRNFGMVFQNYALFPHLTVRQNVAFGLEMRGLKRTAIKERVGNILERVGLAGKEHRYPRQLSGGEQQRTALARALVINPSVLLLDEPLANLDAKLREEMRLYIRALQREFHITTIYVTHDQEEALVLSDRIAVLMNGSLQQLGTPEELYKRPGSAWVASFVGLTNLLPARIMQRCGEEMVLETPIGPVRACGREDLAVGLDSLLSVRPEGLVLTEESSTSAFGGAADDDVCANGHNRLAGVIAERAFVGNLVDYWVAVGRDTVLRVQGSPGVAFAIGDRVAVTFAPQNAWTVPAEGR